jgi:hypothetical protein
MDPDPDSDADPDPAIFVTDLQDANKKLIKKKNSAYYFLKVHLHHFSKIKSQKMSKSRIQKAQKHTDPTDPDPQHWFLR